MDENSSDYLGYDPNNYGGSGLQAIPMNDGTGNMYLVIDPERYQGMIDMGLNPALFRQDANGNYLLPETDYRLENIRLGYGDFQDVGGMVNMPLAFAAIGGGLAGGGFLDPYSLVAGETAAAGAGAAGAALPDSYWSMLAEGGAGVSDAAAAGAGTVGAGAVDPFAAELAGLGASTTELATGLGTMAPAASGGAGWLGTLATSLNGTLGTALTGNDIMRMLSGVGVGLGGYLSADATANSLEGIYNQQRADRQPALDAFNTALSNPDTWYQSAPAMGAADSVLRGLSMQGNPANNPGSMARAAAYNLGGYNNYLANMGNLGLGGQATQAQLGTNLAGAQGGGYEAIGAGLGSIFRQSSPWDDFFKNMPSLTWGGSNSYGR